MITKYRGLSISDNNKGQWVYGNLIVDGNYAYIVNGVIECNDQYITIAEWCPVDHKTIGAFTGMFDKNDVEIFEGDVVRFHTPQLTTIGVVVFNRHEACFKVRNDFGGHWVTVFHTRYFEVIGNIYQNPELLEVENDK